MGSGLVTPVNKKTLNLDRPDLLRVQAFSPGRTSPRIDDVSSDERDRRQDVIMRSSALAGWRCSLTRGGFVGGVICVEMAADRVRCGYPRVSVFRVSGLVLIFRPRFSGSGFGFHPWISKINHLELKLIFYNMLMITCLLRPLNLLKLDS